MRVLKTDVPVDDQWHSIVVGSGILHVDHQRSGFVSVWWLESERALVSTLRVFGTGQPIEPIIPGDFVTYPTHLATVLDRELGAVWHVFER